jgi:predicted RNA-binding protein YlqC (UPF0109 family)
MSAELVEYLAKGLVKHPEQVSVTETQQSGGIGFELRVAQSDYGRIIGRNGQTIDAIRSLVELQGRRQGKQMMVRVVDQAGGGRRGP